MKNLKSSILATGLLITFISFAAVANAQVQTARYVSMVPNTKAYYEYLPQGYSPTGTQTYPLILFIHGLGELGEGTTTTLPRIANNAIPRLIKNGTFPTSFTVDGVVHRFIVISPQFVAWPSAGDIDGVINYLISHYKVDASRIYLTGLSMGGGATWDYAGNQGVPTYPKRLAAIAPICGAAYPSTGKAKVIANANLPVWAFHNSGDPTAPVSYTNDFVAYINSTIPAPNPLAKKTIFNASGHDAWTKAYDPNYREGGKNVYEWMLTYRRSTTTNTPPTVSAGNDKSITLPVNYTQVAATASDPGGSVASYAWTRVAGPSQYSFSSTSATNPTISNLVSGTYTFRVTVTDNQGAQASDDVNVIVNSSTSPPPPPTEGKSVQVNVFGGSNPYSNTQWNNWNIGSGSVSNVTSAAFKYADGTTSAIRASISQSTGVGDNSATYPAGMAPSEVLRYTSYSTTQRTLTISGLSTGTQYSVELYSARSNTGNKTIFVSGSQRDTVLSSNNTTDKVVFSGLVPNSSGQIVVTIQRLNTYSYLNGFKLTENGAATSARTASVEEATISTAESALAVYPNPVDDKVVLQVNNAYTGTMKVQLFDLTGSLIREMSFVKSQPATQTYLSLGDLSSGEYILKVQVGEWTESKKIIKL
jgi:dienelactone hydrolase